MLESFRKIDLQTWANIALFLILGLTYYSSENELSEMKAAYEERYQAYEAERAAELSAIDSLQMLVLKKDTLLAQLELTRDTVYLKIKTNEATFQKMDAISDTTSLAADLRFLAGD